MIPPTELPRMRDILRVHGSEIAGIMATLVSRPGPGSMSFYPGLLAGARTMAKLILVAAYIDEEFIEGKSLAELSLDPTIILLLGSPDRG